MRRLASLTDNELIESINQGCEKAFDILFVRYKDDVRNVILHYVKDRLETEDLTQDAFLKIYTSLKRGKYNDEGKFLPWALRIARNLCMDYLRKGPQRTVSQPVFNDPLFYSTTFCTAETALIDKQQQRHLNGFINRLPNEQKRVVYYRYFDELSFKKIAALMNTNVNTSLGRMRYGLSHLRKQLQQNPSLLLR
jgi:RNA polymerase sigma factor (sigma-70 family)